MVLEFMASLMKRVTLIELHNLFIAYYALSCKNNESIMTGVQLPGHIYS